LIPGRTLTYCVGDWVHIRNPNDLAKPIVAQIYRTWQDRDGQKWINACWYYRPEQTVHRFDKHFYDHEVAKTGQYRDHQIDDVVDRCFVMFVTRFGRGRPRGFPRDKEVYVCESRYNEEKFRFNKIKTWASCVPDEVREKDYEMDLFDGPPQRLRKMPSPIKHLLREDAKESDGLPKPTWGSPNAPPIVGAVHRRPREGNVSKSHTHFTRTCGHLVKMRRLFSFSFIRKELSSSLFDLKLRPIINLLIAFLCHR
jgi:chromatin structure-remodeling complex subunit RSC1/2